MLRRIYRQRRRILFGAFFFTLGFMTILFTWFTMGIFEVYGLTIGTIAMILVAALVFLAYAAVGAVFLTLFPDWRTLVEMVGLIFFLNAVLAALLPGIFAIGFVDAIMPLVLTFALFSLVYGDALSRFRLWMDQRRECSFHSPKSAEELWAELVPGEGDLDQHWDSMLYSIEQDSEEADTYVVQYTHGGSLYEHQTMTFLDKEMHRYARYHHVGEVDPKNKSLVEGTYAIRIDPVETGGCKVTLTATNTAMLHSAALLIWFDDILGDKTDHLAALHGGRSDWSLTGRVRRKIQQYA